MTKVTSKEEVMQLLRDELPDLSDKYGVERIALYGSFAKGTQNAESDVDLIVELSRPLGLDFVGLAQELEQLLGRPVHLSTFEMLDQSKQNERNPWRKHLAEEVESSLIYI